MKVPFFNRENSKTTENGWNIFSAEQDFSRFFDKLDSQNDWRISHVNKNYSVNQYRLISIFKHENNKSFIIKVCGSYPEKVIVPKNIDDETLLKSSKFRADGRFPILSYFHKPTKVNKMTSCNVFISSLP